MKKKVILTKNRLKALDLGITLDDVLYEKYRRIVEDIHRAERRLSDKSRIASVIQIKNNIKYRLQVLKVVPTDEGTIIEVS